VTVSVTNDGTTAAAVTCLSLASADGGCGAPGGGFAFSGLPPLPATLAPGASFPFTLTGAAPDAGDTLEASCIAAGDTIAETYDTPIVAAP